MATSPNRVYLGNLSLTIDEYSLIQLCSKYGKISKMDYLFHKVGPLKGKPRGYAFVEFETSQEALRAIKELNDKLIRGRKIMVTAAAEQTNYPDRGTSSGRGRGGKQVGEKRGPTAISLLKGQGVAGASTDRKIAALEAKLLAIKNRKAAESGTPASSSSTNPETWLNSILPGSLEAGSSSTAGSGGTEGIVKESVKIKAGLPIKPWFESPAVVERESS